MASISLVNHFSKRTVRFTVIRGQSAFENDSVNDSVNYAALQPFKKVINRSSKRLVEPSWILIALIELGPLEENMNPLVFGAQPNSIIKSFSARLLLLLP